MLETIENMIYFASHEISHHKQPQQNMSQTVDPNSSQIKIWDNQYRLQ